MQPFHAHVALPSRHEEAQRITLFRPHSLAILSIGDQHIVERLAERDAAGMPGRVRAFRHDPASCILELRFAKQRTQENAAPLAATHEAMARLDGGGRIASVLATRITGALDEMNSRYRREAPQLVHRELERLFDQPMEEQFVSSRIDRGNA